MHPYIRQALAEQRARDMRRIAADSRLAQQVRRKAARRNLARLAQVRAAALDSALHRQATHEAPVASQPTRGTAPSAAGRLGRQGHHRFHGAWKRLPRRIAATLRECNDAQLRLAASQSSTDPYLPDPDRAPDTYREFCLRTSGALLREPSASARARHGSRRAQ